MKEGTALKVGDLVQLDPQLVKNRMLANCIMVVTEPKSFGAVGYIQMGGKDGQPGGQAYYRAGWDEMELVGLAYWVVAS